MTPTDARPAGADPRHDDPADVVRRFLALLEDLDIEAALDLLDERVVYHNKGLPPARGKAATARQLRAMGKYATAFEARNHNLAADGPIVLTERTDVIEIGRFRAEFWVCGTFEVVDGRIVLWRDYFDVVDLIRAGVVGLVRMLLGRR